MADGAAAVRWPRASLVALAFALSAPASIAVAAPLDGGAPESGGPDAGAGTDGASESGADGGGGGDGGAEAAVAPLPPVATEPERPPAPLVPVEGTAFARGGHRRLKAATVSVDGVEVGETDDRGGFKLELPLGRHQLQIIASGFAPSRLTLELGPTGWSGAVRLEPGGAVFETVVAAKQPTAAVRMTGEEARTAAGTTGDPFRVIESLPGVAQIAWPFALYAIRGANPGNTGFFLDGMRVPALFHFALGPSIVHPYLIEKLSFYPGGYPARYGSYVSGVVSADTVSPPADIVHIAADVRLYDAGGLVTAPWDGGRGTVAVAARYSYTGLIVSRLFPDVDLGYADYQLRADHTLAGGRFTLLSLGSFDALAIHGVEDMGGAAGTEEIGDAQLNFHRLDLRWERPAGGGRFLIRTALSTDHARSQLYDSPIGVRAYGLAPRIAYARPLTKWASFELGVDGEAQRFRTDVVITPSTPPLGDLARSRGALTIGPYAGASFTLGRLNLDPGLRYARYFEQGVSRGALEPRVTARFAVTKGTSLEGTFGRFSQMPSLPLAVAGFEAFSLSSLGLQTSTQAALGVDTRLPWDLSLRLTGFYQWLLVSDLRSTFARDPRQPEFLQMRPGRGYGLETLLRLPERARLNGWLSYTLSWSLRDFDGVYGASDWDQRHILNLVAAYRVAPTWTVGTRFHYNTGRPYPVQTEFGIPEYIRLPDFWHLTLRADKRVLLDQYTLDFYVELGNATLTRQVVAVRRGFDDKVEEIGFRLVLPAIGVHAEW